jgi:predicted nucleotidyltransferase
MIFILTDFVILRYNADIICNFPLDPIRGNCIMPEKTKLIVPKEKIANFCRKNKIRKLSFFGSALRDDFGPDSDVDILIEFEHDVRIGLLGLSSLEIQLVEMIGRKVDLNTPGFLSTYYREKVLAESEVQYDSA